MTTPIHSSPPVEPDGTERAASASSSAGASHTELPPMPAKKALMLDYGRFGAAEPLSWGHDDEAIRSYGEQCFRLGMANVHDYLLLALVELVACKDAVERLSDPTQSMPEPERRAALTALRDRKEVAVLAARAAIAKATAP